MWTSGVVSKLCVCEQVVWAATTVPNETQARHRSQPSAISATPPTQSDDPCCEVPCLRRKVQVHVAKYKLCVSKLCVDELCVDKLFVSKLCVCKLCVSKLCVSKLCGDKLYVRKLCGDKWCGEQVVCGQVMW